PRPRQELERAGEREVNEVNQADCAASPKASWPLHSHIPLAAPTIASARIARRERFGSRSRFELATLRTSLSMPCRAHRLLVGSCIFPDAAIAPLPLLVFQQRFQQARPVEVWPERLSNENFRVGNLPQQKIAYPHLPAGTDQQVRVRQPFGVQMPGKLLLGNFARCSVAVALGKDRVQGVDNL